MEICSLTYTSGTLFVSKIFLAIPKLLLLRMTLSDILRFELMVLLKARTNNTCKIGWNV